MLLQYIDLTQLSDSDDDSCEMVTSEKCIFEDIENIIKKIEKKNTNKDKQFKNTTLKIIQDCSVSPILPGTIDLTMTDDDEIIVEKNEPDVNPLLENVNGQMEEGNEQNCLNTVNVIEEKMEVNALDDDLKVAEVVEKVNLDNTTQSQEKIEAEKVVQVLPEFSEEKLRTKSICITSNEGKIINENPSSLSVPRVEDQVDVDKATENQDKAETVKTVPLPEEKLKTPTMLDDAKEDQILEKENYEQKDLKKIEVENTTGSQKKIKQKKTIQVTPKLPEASSSGRKRSRSDNNQTQISQEKKTKFDNNLDGTFQQLMEIFPDADEEYMQKIAVNTYRHNRSFVAFVNTNLQEPRYQKKIIEQKPQKERVPKDLNKKLITKKIQDTLASYTKNFDVSNFLKIYPHPKHYFEDSKRICQSSSIALEFLQSKFKKCPVNELEKLYQSNNYNLSLTTKKLSDLSYKSETEVKNLIINPEIDLQLLQEIAFINNREEIKEEYLKIKRSQKEKKKIDNLKAEKKFLECQCCFDDKCMPSKCAKCENGHIFCKSCIIKGVNERLSIGDTRIFCFTKCTSEFSLSTLKEVLDPKIFKILVKKRQSAKTVADEEKNSLSCPSCNYTSTSTLDGEKFKCLNPLCMSEPCTESERNEKARKFIEEKMSQALFRNCSNCQRIFIKDYGCNMMLCLCGTSMCYLCSKVVKGDSHFRKQGENIKKNESPKCPYYSDDDFLNAQTVRKIAEEVKKELLEKIPTLDIDIDRLLPSIPPQADGPHKHIPENSDIAVSL